MDKLFRNREYLVVLAAGIVLLLMYGSSFLVPYAKLDTIKIYSNVAFGHFHPWQSWLSIQGRPLASFLIYIVFSKADGLLDLGFVRFIGFLGTFATAVALLFTMKKQGLATLPRLVLSLWICTVPALATFTIWAICFTYSWGVAMAIVGGWLCVAEEDFSWVSKRKLLGFLLIFISLWIYQPSALFALIPLALRILQLKGESVDVFKEGVLSCVWTAGPLPVYFVTYKVVFLRFMPQMTEAMTSRLNPSADYMRQISVVINQAIPESLEGWFNFVHPILMEAFPYLVITIIAAGIVRSFIKTNLLTALIKGGLLTGILVVSLIPVLYLSSGVPFPRMVGAFTGIWVLFVVLAVHLVFEGRWKRVANAIIVILLLLQLGAAALAVNKYWVQQSKLETAAFKEFFAELDKRPHSLILISSRQWIYDGKNRRYLYGFVSTNQNWVLEPLARLFLAERYGKSYALSVPVFISNSVVSAQYSHIVDANDILFDDPTAGVPGTSQWNGFDQLSVLNANVFGGEDPWYASSWFGIFRGDPVNPDQFLQHAVLGRIQYGWDWEKGVLHLKFPECNWATTTPETFPVMRDSADGTIFELILSEDGSITHSIGGLSQ